MKHTGLTAGLGKIAKNDLLIHPIHRLTALITTEKKIINH